MVSVIELKDKLIKQIADKLGYEVIAHKDLPTVRQEGLYLKVSDGGKIGSFIGVAHMQKRMLQYAALVRYREGRQ